MPPMSGVSSIATSSPTNILVTGTGDRSHAYLADFGLTRERGGDRGRTGTGQFAGSVDYAAPEQIRGRPSSPPRHLLARPAWPTPA